MPASLQGKTALVTGASRGIGRAIALSLAQNGADLVLTSSQAQGTAAVEAQVRALGRKATGFKADLARRDEVDALIAHAGAIDWLINNAGTFHRAPVVSTADADWDRSLEVNLTVPFRLSRAFLPSLLKRGHGGIVNISSISGTLGTPQFSAYCASKWGLNGFTKALAEELKNTGVKVFAVLPGSTDTDMLKAAGFTPVMKPDDVANVVRYLCSDAPLAMSGSLVEVFG
ncbi:MAG: SDR family oxidoreductase [Myxococcaceae bacterium]|nr:SDR family oxidoreductase [Myxococcaceae bacterium]